MIKEGKQTARFYELDILRFLAALAVVLFHYTFLNATEFKQIVSYPILGEIFKYGYLGVELFFIISGFVILLTASKKNWRGFIISRLARLYPAFWVAVTLTSLALWYFSQTGASPSWSQYLWNMSMMANIVNVENIDPVYWTLQVELKFYFWIVVILLFKKIKHIEYFIFIWLLVSASEIHHFLHGFSHIILMPEWAPYFSAGAIFYRIQTQGASLLRIALLVFAYGLSLYFAIQGAQDKTAFYALAFSSTVVVAIVTAFFLIFTLIILGKTAKLHHPWLVILGATTYPLYLIHQKLGQIIYQFAGDHINKYLLLLLVTMLMTALAFLLHKLFEVRLGKMMRTKLESWFARAN